MFVRGDRVKCKPGYDTYENSGGSGYIPNKEFIVDKITEGRGGRMILWPMPGYGHGNGIYMDACELVVETPWANSKLVFKFV